jgi:3',5'-cyclic AMP phosphodiesterase CpdA
MPPLRLLQVSDLHVGTREEPDVEAGVRALVAELAPDLVVASGDLTHRNGRTFHERGAAFLRSLGPPVLAVPGNHDMPALPPARFARTFAEFERVWGETEPEHVSDRLAVCGLNSARPWLYQEGVVTGRQIERVRRLLAGARPGALRVVVLHHHLISAPWRTGKRPVARRTRVLRALAEAGADVILSGHVHQSAVVARREFEVLADEIPGTVVVTAPGLGHPRPRRAGEARGLQVVEAAEHELSVDTYLWRRGGFERVASRRYRRA